MDKSDSKSIHISFNTSEVKYANNDSVNMSEVKDAKNETKYEKPSDTDNSVINVLSYFKLFKCGKKILKKLDATSER